MVRIYEPIYGSVEIDTRSLDSAIKNHEVQQGVASLWSEYRWQAEFSKEQIAAWRRMEVWNAEEHRGVLDLCAPDGAAPLHRLAVVDEPIGSQWAYMAGIASRRRSVAVVSTFAFLTDRDWQSNLEQRLLKTAVHEVGHLNGLSHHPDRPTFQGCPMTPNYHYLNLPDGHVKHVDSQGVYLCETCTSWLRGHGKSGRY